MGVVFNIMKFLLNILILAPFIAVAFWLVIKILLEIKGGASDEKKRVKYLRNKFIYPFLLLLVLILILNAGSYLFLPQVKLPVSMQILAIISCIFFWSFLTVIQALGHIAGSGAPPIQKTIKEFIDLVSRKPNR